MLQIDSVDDGSIDVPVGLVSVAELDDCSIVDVSVDGSDEISSDVLSAEVAVVVETVVAIGPTVVSDIDSVVSDGLPNKADPKKMTNVANKMVANKIQSIR
jgi:hypothetical protein